MELAPDGCGADRDGGVDEAVDDGVVGEGIIREGLVKVSAGVDERGCAAFACSSSLRRRSEDWPPCFGVAPPLPGVAVGVELVLAALGLLTEVGDGPEIQLLRLASTRLVARIGGHPGKADGQCQDDRGPTRLPPRLPPRPQWCTR